MKFRFVAAVLLAVVIGAFFFRSVLDGPTPGPPSAATDEGYRLAPETRP